MMLKAFISKNVNFQSRYGRSMKFSQYYCDRSTSLYSSPLINRFHRENSQYNHKSQYQMIRFLALPPKLPDDMKTLTVSTLNELLNQSVKKFPNNQALGTFMNDPKKGKYYEWLTYSQLNDLIHKFRRVLHRYNIEKNDKVAIICNNRVEWAIAVYAVNSLGAQLVPMYEAQLEKDWKYIIEDSNSKVLLVGPESIYNQVKGYPGTVGRLQAVLCFDANEDYLYSYKRSMKLAESDPDPRDVLVTADDHAVVIYTSGTTGKPKGVILSHRNIVENVKGLRAVMADDMYQHTALAFLPWAHVFGQVCDLHVLIATGGAIAIVSHRELILECLPLVKPTMISSVPMLFNKIYDGVHKKVSNAPSINQNLFHWAMSVSRKRNHALEYNQKVSWFLQLQHRIADQIVFHKIRNNFGGNLMFMGSGGAGVALKVSQFFEDIGIPILEGYGLTETSPIISAGSLGWSNRRLGCVGVPLHNLDVRIIDPSTLKSQPANMEGEIIVSGPSVMVGYLNNPKANDEVFVNIDGKRFFRTGDLGTLIEGKFLKITGRLKEQYKLENGKYVVPAPLEDDLTRSLFISQAFLYGTNRPYNIALIVLEFSEVKNWVLKQNISIPDKNHDIINHPRVIELIAQEISQSSGIMKSYERPAKFAILEEPFTQENQMLTPKMSLRRNNVLNKYQSLIDDLYVKGHGHKVPRAREHVDETVAMSP